MELCPSNKEKICETCTSIYDTEKIVNKHLVKYKPKTSLIGTKEENMYAFIKTSRNGFNIHQAHEKNYYIDISLFEITNENENIHDVNEFEIMHKKILAINMINNSRTEKQSEKVLLALSTNKATRIIDIWCAPNIIISIKPIKDSSDFDGTVMVDLREKAQALANACANSN
jgi:hypothetical protein